MTTVPRKLKQDSLNEAVFEVRFQSRQSNEFPELVITKISEFGKWKGYPVIRSPLSDIPFQIRIQDPNLLRQPILELHAPNGQVHAKIGTHSVSLHQMAPYPGWEPLSGYLAELIDYLFSLFDEFKVTRLGLRYINAFTQVHQVKGVSDLAYKLSISGEMFTGPQNINYMLKPSEKHTAVVRIASPELLAAPTPGIAMLVDVDVYTSENETITSATETYEWLVAAHEFEKIAFFNLFTDEMMKNLVEH